MHAGGAGLPWPVCRAAPRPGPRLRPGAAPLDVTSSLTRATRHAGERARRAERPATRRDTACPRCAPHPTQGGLPSSPARPFLRTRGAPATGAQVGSESRQRANENGHKAAALTTAGRGTFKALTCHHSTPKGPRTVYGARFRDPSPAQPRVHPHVGSQLAGRGSEPAAHRHACLAANGKLPSDLRDREHVRYGPSARVSPAGTQGWHPEVLG